MRAARSLLDSLLGLLFPDRCAGCGRFGGLFCPRCSSTLVAYTEPLGRLPAGLTDLRIAFVFDGALREAIHQLKYRRRRAVAGPLGALLARRADAPAPVTLVPIPLHPTRLAERGFNQAEALARAVADMRGYPLLCDGLARVRATEQQARMAAGQRRENIRGAFAWQRRTPPPPCVLLVDDVLTTGATMAACAEALLAAGAREVRGLALARSLPPRRARIKEPSQHADGIG